MDFKSGGYFTEYENLEVHELMLRDRPRMEAYKLAILSNAALFRDKVVIDVGAGIGILSVFCAQAGAKIVYAVEASNSAKIAEQVVHDNRFTSIIRVINSKVEDFQLPADVDKIDIIVSEWMGHYLLHESMLDSVLYARDQFLKKDGLIFPNECKIYVAPCVVPSYFEDWNNVDDVCLTAFSKMLRYQTSSKPKIIQVSPNNLLNRGRVLYWMDLMDINSHELDEIIVKDVVVVDSYGEHQGFCIWFDCLFPSNFPDERIVLSTAPNSPLTHWKQCVIVLPDEACENVEKGTAIAFNLAIKRNIYDKRKYNLEIELLDPNDIEHPLPCDCHMTKCILIKTHLKVLEKGNHC